MGNPVRDPLTEDATSGGLIAEGVLADGSPNTKRVSADSYIGYYYWGNASRNPGALTVYDASFVKLREMSLSFNLPKSITQKFARNVSFSLIGRNLLILHKNVPYADPESGLGAGNAQGYLSGSFPTVRSLGVSLKFDF